MKTIAVSNFKGGVGKTTTAGHLAYLLSLKNKVCLIDADSQGNSSQWLLTMPFNYELADVLSGTATPGEALQLVKDNFYIIPTRGKDGNLRNYGEVKLNEEPFIFDDLRQAIEGLNFDFLIYDMSPALGRVERSVLSAADEVITPITPEMFSINGILTFTHELNKLKKNLRLNITHEKIICNNVNLSFKIHKDALEALEGNDYDVYVIPQDSEIKKAQEVNKTVFEFNAAAKSIKYYETLAGAYGN